MGSTEPREDRKRLPSCPITLLAVEGFELLAARQLLQEQRLLEHFQTGRHMICSLIVFLPFQRALNFFGEFCHR